MTVDIIWDWQDIQCLRPEWDKQKCVETLTKMSKVLTERSIEEGWYIIRDLLSIYEAENK